MLMVWGGLGFEYCECHLWIIFII